MKEEDLKSRPIRSFALLFAQALLLAWSFWPWSSPEQHHNYMPAWPCIPLTQLLTSGLDLESVSSLWTCLVSLDPWLTMVTEPSSWPWRNFRPASLLWICLATQTLVWSWLPSLDLLCLSCLGTVGLGPCCRGHCPYLLCHLLLAPSSPLLMEKCLSKGTAWRAWVLKSWSLDHRVNKTRRKASGVSESYPRALATSTTERTLGQIHPKKALRDVYIDRD